MQGDGKGRNMGQEEKRMKLVSERSGFRTDRRVCFRGRDDEMCSGKVKITIKAEGITTEKMAAQLERLAEETAARARKIVAEQEAPKQFYEGAVF